MMIANQSKSLRKISTTFLLMKKFVLTISLTILFCTACAAAQSPVYTLTIPDDNPGVVKVEARFVLQQEELFMVDWGAEHLPNHWATFLQNMQLKDGAGKAIPLEASKPDRWKVKGIVGQPVTLTYEVRLKHADYPWPVKDREAAYARDWGVFYVCRGLFILNSGKAENIQLDFALPKGWRISAPWKRKALHSTSFIATDTRDLLQAVIFAGTHLEFSIKEGEVEIIFALGGEPIIAARELFEQVTRAVLKSYLKLFGGAPPDSRMLIVINPEYKAESGGGVFGRSISMTFRETPSKNSIAIWGHTISHEIFHLWNGVAIGIATPEEEWFKEGFTDYYSVLMMTRLGFFDERILFFKEADKYASYYNHPAQISFRQAGFEKPKYAGYLYGGGYTVAIALDLDLRQRTHHEKSLDDLMRELYREYGNTSKRLSLNVLLEKLNRLSGADYSDFFKRHIDGTERLRLDQYLNYAGLSLKIENNHIAGFGAITRKPNPTPAEQAFLSKYLSN
jgi:predicted metalloprotease with PDZ domain